MNSRCIYFVEGPCEDKLISAIKLNPSIIISGKVKVYNVIQELIPNSQLLAIPQGALVVFVYDTDVDNTESVIICLKSINNYKECCPKEVAEYILQECRERNGDYIVSLKATDWAETIRVYDSQIECITYNPDRGCFLDYDVYHPEKPRELLLEKCILFCYQNDWKEYFPDGIDGYYYLDSVGNLDIFTNIE